MMLLDIGLRATIVVLAALMASAALRRRSAALRHWVVAAGIFSAAAVAPLGRALPAWDLPLSTPDTIPAPSTMAADSRLTLTGADTVATPTTTPTPSRPPIDVARLALAVWAPGFAISLLLILWSCMRLVRVTRRAAPVTDARWLAIGRELAARLNLRGEVALLESDLPGMVGTWGWRRPRVLLPAQCASWSDARIRIVLGHELAHIRRGDWGIQMAAEIVRAAFWCHPLFWIACARLRRESEQACDDAVLEAGVPATEYASQLLAIARTCRPAPSGAVMPIARPSTLEWRIAAMLNTTLTRRRPTRRALAFAFAVIAAITLSAASFRATEQTGPMPLTGTAYDMTGAVLPGMTITLEDAAGVRTDATTDRAGRFDLGVIAPGRYTLTSTLMGFASITQDVNLQTAPNWERAITLQVGTLQETVTVREQRPASAQSATRQPVRIGGNIRPPRKLEDVRPVYPQAMRDAGFEGAVPLGAVIGVDGRVTSVRVLSSHAHPELAKAALDAVSQWRFSPTLLNGETVEVFMNVTVNFSLSD
jgi:TonB family protein